MNRLRIPSPLPDDLEELVHATIGACIAVHDEVGPGLLEGVYARALTIELDSRDISYETERLIPITYKGHPLGDYRLDVLVGGRLIVELKAVERLLLVHVAQMLTYLSVTKCRIGLLMNFNVEVLRSGIRRVVL
jgi:GxxExxY protein